MKTQRLSRGQQATFKDLFEHWAQDIQTIWDQNKQRDNGDDSLKVMGDKSIRLVLDAQTMLMLQHFRELPIGTKVTVLAYMSYPHRGERAYIKHDNFEMFVPGQMLQPVDENAVKIWLRRGLLNILSI